MIDKTYAYVVRLANQEKEILVFRHRDFPEAGVQVPGGTVEEGESLKDAVIRELFEESGLKGLQRVGYLGAVKYHSELLGEWHMRHFFELAAPQSCPETWAHTVSDGAEDFGMVYLFEWWPLDVAEQWLDWKQGAGIPFLAGSA